MFSPGGVCCVELCSWAVHFTLAVPDLSSQAYKWLSASYKSNLVNNMVGVTFKGLRILFRGEEVLLIASCCEIETSCSVDHLQLFENLLSSILVICFSQQEIAEQTGNLEEAEKLRNELDDLEEKAQHLDKVRSKNLSAIRYMPRAQHVNSLYWRLFI